MWPTNRLKDILIYLTTDQELQHVFFKWKLTWIHRCCGFIVLFLISLSKLMLLWDFVHFGGCTLCNLVLFSCGLLLLQHYLHYKVESESEPVLRFNCNTQYILINKNIQINLEYVFGNGPTWLTSTAQCARQTNAAHISTGMVWAAGDYCSAIAGEKWVSRHCPIQAAIWLLAPSPDEKLPVAVRETFI